MGRWKGWAVRTATGHMRTVARHAILARSERFDGRDEEQMAVESEERGATVEMGKEEKEKKKNSK